MASHHYIVFPQRRVLPVAAAFALAGLALSPSWTMRLVCLGFALASGGLWLWQNRTRPEVVLDEGGYAVLERGQEKLRVRWSEVVRVRADPQEKAAYVDCGDKGRNLLVPPHRGFGFRFERQDELYATILDAVPDKVELVERLDA